MMNKQMPFSQEAEQSILGSIFFDPNISIRIIGEIEDSDFYFNNNALIFSAIKALVESEKKIDIISVTSLLKSRNLLEQVGGISYIRNLTELMPSSANIDTYISIVKSKSLLRQVIKSCDDIKEKMISEQDSNVDDLLDYCEDKIYNITNQRKSDSFDEIRNVLNELINNIEMNRSRGNIVSGISSGFRKYDELTLGFQPGELVILAARPAMGKSALAINMAMNVARNGKSVAIFTLEMSSEQVALRMLSATSKVNSRKLRNGIEITNQEWKNVAAAKNELENYNIYFEDSSGIKISELYTKCRQLRQQNKLDFVVIDYLQLLSGTVNYGGNRVTEVSEISRKLKNLARDLRVPVLALSQLSRNVESRSDKHPQMSDLRESGSIEQDADIVMFLYRENYYEPTDTPSNRETVELDIKKNRSGGLGKCDLVFTKSIGEFHDVEYSDQYADTNMFDE